jgi:hypothetical protein
MEGKEVIDFPTAWVIARTVWYGNHHELCSFRATEGGTLCDCEVLNDVVALDKELDLGQLNTDYVLDLDNKPVVVGDRVAYAAVDGRSSALRLGKVIEIRAAHKKDKYTDVPVKLRIEVEVSSGYKVTAPVLIEAGMQRFVKIG